MDHTHRSDRRNFTLIKGGCDEPLAGSSREFLSAYVTDTRLMGVVGLYIQWRMVNTSSCASLHQFFYFDAEEYGLENYQSIIGTDEIGLSVLEKSIVGGLGGKKVELTEKEACYLVQEFVSDTKRLKQPLPEGQEEYGFILEEPAALNRRERAVVEQKLCTPIESDYQLVNYYLMRAFGQDQKGLYYLTAPEARMEDLHALGEAKPCTLCKNTIEEFVNPDGVVSYLNESVIECGTQYKLVVSEIHVEDGLVRSALRRSSFPITTAEVSMMLARPEFVTVFEILAEPEEFDLDFAIHSAGFQMSAHENGHLFMEFKKNNSHVNQKVFRLNDDVHGLYYISDFGQLIVAAYTLPAIREVEIGLQKSPLNLLVLPTAKYEFKEPVLYEFIHSDFEDFDDFLDSLRTD